MLVHGDPIEILGRVYRKRLSSQSTIRAQPLFLLGIQRMQKHQLVDTELH